MKHIVCLTKSYNYDDLNVWFKYHDKMGYRIHLIDNESDPSISSSIMTWLIEGTEHTYEKLKGWPTNGSCSATFLTKIVTNLRRVI